MSVRLLAYNHAEYIEPCLDAILGQKTSFDYEIVIGEDASTDDTREICISYAEKYPEKIRLFLNDRSNNIPIYNKPSGLFNSIYTNFMITSKYVAMCEADDLWGDPLKLQKAVTYLEKHPETVMCFGSFLVDDRIGSYPKLAPLFQFDQSKTLNSEEILNTPAQTSNIIYRNGLIDKYDKHALGILQGDLLLKVKLSQRGSIDFIADILPSIYRVHQHGCHGPLDRLRKLEIVVEAYRYLIRYTTRSPEMSIALHNNLAWTFLRILIFEATKYKKISNHLLLNFISSVHDTGIPFLFFLSRKVRKHVNVRLNKIFRQ